MGKWGTGKHKKICQICNIEFECWSGREAKFCSRICQTKGRVKKQKKYNHFLCKECGKECKRRQGAGGTNEFCSIKCMAKMRGRKMARQNHPK